jgi:hypothetical protein
MNMKMSNYDKALLDPTQVFHTPQEVLDDIRYSREEKIEILRRWAYDAELEEVAKGENMRPLSEVKNIDLADIIDAIRQLGADVNLNNHPTKAGGA